MHNSPRIRFAFCAKAAHKGPNLFCHRVPIPPSHMKKEQTDHDRTALPFRAGAGPTAGPPAVAVSSYTRSDKKKNLPLVTYIL